MMRSNISIMTTTPASSTRTTHIDVGDAELAYWERGPRNAAETIFLAHASLLGDWFSPAFDEPALDGFRVVRVHRAGYGDSSRPDNHLSLADHARQCCTLLGEIGVSRAHWIGHSSSACIGLQAALDYPDLIASLVLLEPAPNPAGPSSAQLTERVVGPTMAAVGAGNYALAADRFLAGVIGPGYRVIVQARLGVDAFDRLTRNARFFFTNEILAAVEWGMKPDLAARITARTLLVVGEHSGEVTRAFEETAAILTELLPAARTVVLPGAGHGMPLQDPAAIAQLIADFVREPPCGEERLLN